MLEEFKERISLPIYRRAFLTLMLTAGWILILGQWTDIDLMVEDYYYDEQLKAFPWLDTWFAKDLMHGYVKNVIIKSGYLLILVVILDAIFRFSIINTFSRTRMRFVAIASVLVPTVIRGVKEFSVLHCPWTIDRYGGSAPFLRLLDRVPEGMQAGQCFPAGHATVGLWLAALCVFWLPHKPKVALAVFFGGLGVGLILGWVQQMRGAHFLFHTLWAAWLASLVIVVMLMFANKIIQEQQK
ncbi:MAG: PAP2 family protein [Methylophilaceae bacterium]|nr:PAP2 family protein [Methylophilaceae bacterium]